MQKLHHTWRVPLMWHINSTLHSPSPHWESEHWVCWHHLNATLAISTHTYTVVQPVSKALEVGPFILFQSFDHVGAPCFHWCWTVDCSLSTILQDCWFPPDMKSHVVYMWPMMVVSSSYSKIEFSWRLGMQISNKRGLGTQPWGAPVLSTNIEEVWLPIRTLWGCLQSDI